MRNKDQSIPRDFPTTARSRVEWLEECIKQLAPSFDLAQGPKVDFSFLEGSHRRGSPARGRSDDGMSTPAPGKRTFRSVESSENQQQQNFSSEAHSVAVHLGMLSLNSDSRQKHYLGSSSGRLFSSLIGVAGNKDSGSNSQEASTNTVAETTTGSRLRGKTQPFAQTKQLKESCKNLLILLKAELPSREDARALLDVFFRSIHVDHPFLHPTSLVNALNALYHCSEAADPITFGQNAWVENVAPFAYNGEYESIRDANITPISIFTATFHIFMVFTLAATIQTRNRNYDFAPKQFYRVATSVAHECFSTTSIASLQATLLLAVHSLLGPAEVNIWTLTHIAMAHCIDLGLHRAVVPNAQINATTSTIRRLIFFSVYHLDRAIAAIQGRPLGFRDETFDVRLPDLSEIRVDYLELQNPDLMPDEHFASLAAFSLHRYRLDTIVSDIKLTLYHLPNKLHPAAAVMNYESELARIREDLDDWRKSIQEVLNFSIQGTEDSNIERRKHETKLEIQYHNTMILLYQPSQMIPQPSEDSLLVCYQCAVLRLKGYSNLSFNDDLNHSWRSVQGIFASGAVMVYCLWTSEAVRRSIPLPDIIRDLRMCTNLLSQGGEWWPSVKRGRESFERALDALLKRLGSAPDARDGQIPKRTDTRMAQSAISTTSISNVSDVQISPESSMTTFPDFSVSSAGYHSIGHLANLGYRTIANDLGPVDWTILDVHPQVIYNSELIPAQSIDGSEIPQFENWENLDPLLDSTIESFISGFWSGGSSSSRF
jgi:hypothetical protein